MTEGMAVNRREFLRLGVATGAVVMAASVLPGFSWANVRTVGVEDCLAMSPAKMVDSSKVVQDALQYLQSTIETIGDAKVRKVVAEMIADPMPTFYAPLADGGKKGVWDELTAKNLIEGVDPTDFLPPVADRKKIPQPFITAPGSGYQSHHSYPGGVVTHTALNVRLALAIHQHYQETYGVELDRDVIIASQLLHDIHKGWVFQWGDDGSSRTEQKLAGTGEHHVYSIAESIARGLPSEICVAQAYAHNHPGTAKDEAEVVGWIQAAAILLGIDPTAKGLLAAGGKTLPVLRRMENFVCHLGDHDYVLSVPVVQWLLPEMQAIAKEKYQMSDDDLRGKKFNAFRNYAFSQVTAMNLYHHYSATGKTGLAEKLTAMIVPA
jgi:hypothetical protein